MASPRMREVLDALEWVRAEMWRFGSPDFIRQREMERRVGQICASLLQGKKVANAPARKRPRRSVRPLARPR